MLEYNDNTPKSVIWKLTSSDFSTQKANFTGFTFFLVDDNDNPLDGSIGKFHYPNAETNTPSSPLSGYNYDQVFGQNGFYPLDSIDSTNPQTGVYGPRDPNAVIKFMPTDPTVYAETSYRFEIHIVASY